MFGVMEQCSVLYVDVASKPMGPNNSTGKCRLCALLSYNIATDLAQGLYLEAFRIENGLAHVQDLYFEACRTEKSLARVCVRLRQQK